MTVDQEITFRTLDGRKFRGRVRNTSATLGSVAGRLATKAGISGAFEVINSKGSALDPSITLGDLPETDNELTLSSELTPA